MVQGGRKATIDELTQVVEARMDAVPVSIETQKELAQMTQDVRRDLQGATHIAALEGNTAGQFNGSAITVDSGTILGESSLTTDAVVRHELKHKQFSHHVGLRPGASAEGTTVVHIGTGPDSGFTETALKEAITLIDTQTIEGSSAEYQGYVSQLYAAIDSSDVTLSDVRTVVDVTKDLSSIDVAEATTTWQTEQQPASAPPAEGWEPRVIRPDGQNSPRRDSTPRRRAA
jgi:hypothetical protein